MMVSSPSPVFLQPIGPYAFRPSTKGTMTLDRVHVIGNGAADAHAGLFFNKERDRFLDYGVALRKTDTHVFLHQALPPVDDLRARLPAALAFVEDLAEGSELARLSAELRRHLRAFRGREPILA